MSSHWCLRSRSGHGHSGWKLRAWNLKGTVGQQPGNASLIMMAAARVVRGTTTLRGRSKISCRSLDPLWRHCSAAVGAAVSGKHAAQRGVPAGLHINCG